LADEYHVHVKMSAGPFAIDEKNDSVIRPKKSAEAQFGTMR
jgi:hypothetical protein